jgi:DtxR family Mn-dependent transcriptional regulator
MRAVNELPIVLPCHGTSSLGDRADDVASDLAARGLAEVVEDIEELVAAAREGRAVIALDACSASCQARLLDARGVQTLRSLTLSERGAGEPEVGSVQELQAATTPVKHTRRSLHVPASELSARRMHSLDDYLLALDTLTSPVVECGAVADAPTLAAHVAHSLGVSRPAAGEMLARLEDAGFVRRGAHKDVLLTVAGRAEADRILRKQRILECFVTETLRYPVAECYERAREISSGFGEDAVERMWEALDRPARCPHGWAIDPAIARAEGRELVALSAVSPGSDAMVARLDETSADRLRALIGSGVEPGSELTGVTVHRAADTVAFAAGGRRRSISTALATSVLVRS